MSHTLVIFGASGDLTERKLVPALYQLHVKGRLPEPTRIVGFSRTEYSHDAWRAQLAASTRQFAGGAFQQDAWDRFAASVFYHRGDLTSLADVRGLATFLDGDSGGGAASGESETRLYYLATAPRFYEPAIAHLGQSGLADPRRGERRVVVEKPFGTDLATARRLNESIHRHFAEDQIYRIDHYLGKETVQNILVLRFANAIFEPIWNRHYIDHVQITVAEEVAVGDRGPYYDQAGVIRDMFQNHLLQLLMITAMEVPVRYNAQHVRDEKVKVLQAIRPWSPEHVAADTIRGQYRGYHDERGVEPGSATATFAAMKLWIDNWRWQGVPFYLRSGKRMSCRTTQLMIAFRKPPQMLFGDAACELQSDSLIVQIQPAEGIQLRFQTKVPDAGMKLRLTDLDFSFSREFRGVMPEAYERLLLDALQGDASLFARSDEVELAWTICDPVISAWRELNQPELEIYEPGFWGPESSSQWMQRQGRYWFDACPVLH